VPLGDRLSAGSSSDIVSYLRGRNLPFEVDENSGMILVPDNKLQELRLQLASDGLGNGADAGLEVLQKDQSIGTSQFMEQARYQHALETELSRTVAKLRGVASARVHLAVPKRTSFIRDRAKPSASVMLKMTPGRVLDEGQIQGIVHLVASSVPYLELSRVSVVDQWGRLLSKDNDNSALGVSTRQFEFTRTMEQAYSARIESLLAPIVGQGKVQAKVNAVLDFTHKQRRDEIYTGNPQKLRSEQIQDQSTSGAGLGGGIPGALTNQPPAGGKVTTGQSAAQQNAAPAAETETASNGNYNKSTTRNYELNKTISSTEDAPGRLRRLSIAVIVDDRTQVSDKGEVTQVSRDEKELDNIAALVKEAVGFDAKRGDTVQVINRRFEKTASLEALPAPGFWEQSWFSVLIKNVFAAILIALVLLLVIRPALRSLTNKSEKNAKNAKNADSNAAKAVPVGELARLESVTENAGAQSGDPLAAPPRVYGDILNLAREMAAEDPRRVATLLRQWVDNDD